MSLNEDEKTIKDFGRERIHEINKNYIQDFLLAPEINFLEMPEKIRSQVSTISFTNDATIPNQEHLDFNPLLRLSDSHGCEIEENRQILLNFINGLL